MVGTAEVQLVQLANGVEVRQGVVLGGGVADEDAVVRLLQEEGWRQQQRGSHGGDRHEARRPKLRLPAVRFQQGHRGVVLQQHVAQHARERALATLLWSADYVRRRGTIAWLCCEIVEDLHPYKAGLVCVVECRVVHQLASAPAWVTCRAEGAA